MSKCGTLLLLVLLNNNIAPALEALYTNPKEPGEAEMEKTV